MSLRDLAASLLVVRIGSNMVPPRRVAEDLGRVRELIDRVPIGGLLLFNGVWPDTREALDALQRRAMDRLGRPLLVMSDIERGVGQQVTGATLFPHALAFDHTRDPENAVREFVRVKAAEARACGIHLTLGPMADVHRNLDSPIIATRAFSTDPEQAGRLAQVYVEACREEGLLACAKHFPGHGGTSEDSHAVVPVVHDSRAELDRTDLLPFRAVIAAGCPLIMTAHLAVPALDPSGLPATRSRTIIEDVLRGELGFRGAVISDSLLMGGAEPGDQPVAVEAVAAGVDLLLDPEDAAADVEALLAAVASGALPEARLREAAARVAALHAQVAGAMKTEAASSRSGGGVGTEAHRQVAASVARDAITVVAGAPSLDLDAPLLAVMVRPTASHLDPDEQPLGAALRERFPHVTYAEIGPEASPAELDALRTQAAQVADGSPTPRLLLAAVSKPSAWRAAGLPDWQERLIHELCQRQPAVLVALGNPRVLHSFGECAHQIVTYSDVAASQHALVDVLADRSIPSATARPQPSIS